MELEGLTAWRGGRAEGNRLLETAVDADGFYDRDGAIAEGDYRY